MIKDYQQLIDIKNQEGGLTLAFGCFDILHYGHLNFINKVLELSACPVAIGVLPDQYVKATKGENRPLNNEEVRLKTLDDNLINAYSFLVNEKGDYSYYKEKFNLCGKEVLWQYPINALYLLKPSEFYYSTDFPLTKEILAVFSELNIKHQAVAYTEGISSTAIIEELKSK